MKMVNNNKCLKLLMLSLMIAVLFTASGCNEAVSDIIVKDNVPDMQAAVLANELPDFSAIKDIKEKKKRFFSFVRPIIEAENERVLSKREKLIGLYKKHIENALFSTEEVEWLDRLHAEYRINDDDDPEFVWTDSLRRVDALPVELAMTQAAKESGWGVSRFVRTGNNIFGQLCFVKGCGIVPVNRDEGAIHEVRKFESVRASVRSYIRNLNTNSAYEGFRQLRFDQRQAGEELEAYSLISGLPRYSVRGEAYLEEIRAMILANRHIMGS